jgi:hypothetical protein
MNGRLFPGRPIPKLGFREQSLPMRIGWGGNFSVARGQPQTQSFATSSPSFISSLNSHAIHVDGLTLYVPDRAFGPVSLNIDLKVSSMISILSPRLAFMASAIIAS